MVVPDWQSAAAHAFSIASVHSFATNGNLFRLRQQQSFYFLGETRPSMYLFIIFNDPFTGWMPRWATVIVHVLFTVSTAVFVLLQSQTIIFISMACCTHASYKNAQLFFYSVRVDISLRTSKWTIWPVMTSGTSWPVPICLSFFCIDIWVQTVISHYVLYWKLWIDYDCE